VGIGHSLEEKGFIRRRVLGKDLKDQIEIFPSVVHFLWVQKCDSRGGLAHIYILRGEDQTGEAPHGREESLSKVIRKLDRYAKKRERVPELWASL